MSAYGMTPGALVRQVQGEPAGPEYFGAGPVGAVQLAAEAAERHRESRAWWQSHGLHIDRQWVPFVGADGLPTPAALEMRKMTIEHQRHMTGEQWVTLTDDETRELVRRMHAAQAADSAMADAERRAAQMRADMTARVAGIAGGL